MEPKIDSIIFDMDGTLWDALSIYTAAWNQGLAETGVHRIVAQEEIAAMMGWEKHRIFDQLLPQYTPTVHEEVYNRVNDCSVALIPQMKGRLYEGVKEGLQQLAAQYPLYILSNCAVGIIDLFMEATDIRPFITGHIAHGENFYPKHQNIALLKNRHHLKYPVYVGDTHEDSIQCQLAGIPFVHVSYGFGQTENYHRQFHTFADLTAYYRVL